MRWLLILFLLFHAPAWAVIAEVPAVKASAVNLSVSSAPTLAFAGSISSGGLLTICGVVSILTATGVPPDITITDDQVTNSWTTVMNSVTGTWASTRNYKTFIAWAIATTTATPTITVTPSTFYGGSMQLGFFLDAFTGVDTATPTDGAAVGGETTSVTPAVTITTTQNDGLILGFAAKNNSLNPTTWSADPAGYTSIGNDAGGGNLAGKNCVFNPSTGSGANALSWTTNSGGQNMWTTQAQGFRAAATGGASGSNIKGRRIQP